MKKIKIPKCMYCVPGELTGVGDHCALLSSSCNHYDERCLAFRKHTKESREELTKLIEEKMNGGSES